MIWSELINRRIPVLRLVRAILVITPLVGLYLQVDQALKIVDRSSRSLRAEKDVVSALTIPFPSQSDTYIAPEYEVKNITLSYYELVIRYPARAFQRLNARGNVPLIAGVLSTSDNQEKRQAIRDTWAYNRLNVFFIISGDWTEELATEAINHHDILWIDDEEDYRRLTWKTLAFFRAARKWLGNVKHVLKADDDSYVNMEAIENYLESNDPDYLGYCMKGQSPRFRQMLEDVYPPYASGAGYLISNSFLRCMDDLADRWPSVIDEDANTGLLARECSVSCQHDDRILPWRNLDGGFYLDEEYEGWVHHYVKAVEEMTYIHSEVCDSDLADTASCGPGSDRTAPDELPLYCNWRLVDSCGECVENDIHRRDPRDVCNGSCYICPWAREEPTRCIPKTQPCVPPEGFMQPRPRFRHDEYYDSSEGE